MLGGCFQVNRALGRGVGLDMLINDEMKRHVYTLHKMAGRSDEDSQGQPREMGIFMVARQEELERQLANASAEGTLAALKDEIFPADHRDSLVQSGADRNTQQKEQEAIAFA